MEGRIRTYWYHRRRKRRKRVKPNQKSSHSHRSHLQSNCRSSSQSLARKRMAPTMTVSCLTTWKVCHRWQGPTLRQWAGSCLIWTSTRFGTCCLPKKLLCPSQSLEARLWRTFASNWAGWSQQFPPLLRSPSWLRDAPSTSRSSRASSCSTWAVANSSSSRWPTCSKGPQTRSFCHNSPPTGDSKFPRSTT